MKGSATVYRPIKFRSKSAVTNNMFQNLQKDQEVPTHLRESSESYDFVGPFSLRKKLMMKPLAQNIQKKVEQSQKAQKVAAFNETTTSKNMFNTTINRNTILSSLLKDQQVQLTKQKRNLQRYREYQSLWEKKKDSIRLEIKKKRPLLMESNIKSVFAQQNIDKNDTINNYIVHYWEMSLRNNNPILERHIKGHNFDLVEKQKLLQLREGIKKIEDSIPMLPLQRLSNLNRKDLSLSGRNKYRKQAQGSSSKTSSVRYSMPNSSRHAQQQVFLINYEGGKKWMGGENL